MFFRILSSKASLFLFDLQSALQYADQVFLLDSMALGEEELAALKQFVCYHCRILVSFFVDSMLFVIGELSASQSICFLGSGLGNALLLSLVELIGMLFFLRKL